MPMPTELSVTNTAKQQQSTGKNQKAPSADNGQPPSRVSQKDVPAYTLSDALKVPKMIADQFARKPVAPLKLAAAMKVQPTSSGFRMLTGAAIAYGLTKGAWNAQQIEIATIGLRIVHVTREGDDLAAKREAILTPRVFGAFLKEYNGHPIPRRDIALNVLVDLGVPNDRAERTLDMMLEGAKSVGFITTINGKDYVSLEGIEGEGNGDEFSSGSTLDVESDGEEGDSEPQRNGTPALEVTRPASVRKPGPGNAPTDAQAQARVFVTHGKNTKFVETIKKLIRFGKLEPVVAVEKQSVAKPVPDKVMDEMRSCGAAIIHVDAEGTFEDQDGQQRMVLNSNVLIEIGAAFALYGRRFILLVRDGVQLPSNLQGLYEVRYTGDVLDANATIKLLEAITDIQNHALPNRYGEGQA